MINENTYLSRLIDTFMFIRDMVSTVDEDYVLAKANSMGTGVREIIQDPNMWINNSVPSEEHLDKVISEVVKQQTAKVGNYRKWILGYGLVLLCAIFDDFLIKLLEEILDTNSQLTTWNSRSEILSRFKEETIKGKYRAFVNKLGFSGAEFFDFSIFIPSVRNKFDSVDISKLEEIYKKRNKAAHSDGYVIYTVDDLSDIRELFEKLTWNLSIKCRRKWGIKSELIEIVKKYGH